MNKFNGKQTPPDNPDATSATAERRRLGRIVHDDRGSASLEWRDAPEDYERPVLEVEGGSSSPRESRVRRGLDVLSIKNDDTFNPYDRSPDPDRDPNARTAKRDLRKLSAWLKMMRELEERKKNGDDD